MKAYFSNPQTAPLFWALSPIFIIFILFIYTLNHFSFCMTMQSNPNVKSISFNWVW